MSTTPPKIDDDIDALEALESEEKEFNKVSKPLFLSHLQVLTCDSAFHRMQKLIES